MVKTHNIFVFFPCLLQIYVNKSQEDKINLSGRSEFWGQTKLGNCIREGGWRWGLPKTLLFPCVPLHKSINILKSQFANYKKGEG